MEADFDRFYRRDLAHEIWRSKRPASWFWNRIVCLPDDSAFGRAISKGHTKDSEILAQIRDAVVTQAHGYRLQGRPEPYKRPGMEDRHKQSVDPTNPEDAASIRRFFGTRR